MGTFFYYIYKKIGKFPWLLLTGILILAGFSGYFATKLKFTEDISRVLPHSEKIDHLNFVLENARFMEKVIFNIHLRDSTQDPNPARLVDFANSLVDSLQTGFLPGRLHSIDLPPSEREMLEVYDEVYQNLPLFLSESDYETIDSLLDEERIDQALASDYRTLISPVGFGAKRMIRRDPLHFSSLAMNKLNSFGLSENLEIYGGHFLTKDRKNLLVIVTPLSTNNTAANKVLFGKIDDLIDTLKQEKFQDIQAAYFGSPVVALGNAERIKQDIILTVSLAASLLLLFISLFFRRKRAFLVIFLPVVFGGLFSLAALYLIKSEVSAISLGIGSVLLGISIDYALHIFSHHRNDGNVKKLLKDLSTPVILSSITTASAFLTLHFIDAEALQDLGLFSALAVLSAAFFSLLVLPHLLPANQGEKLSFKNNIIDRIANFNYSGNRYIILTILFLTVVFLFLIRTVSFDADMMKNNYMRPELAKAEEELNAVTSLSRKTIYTVSTGRTLDEAMTANVKHAGEINQLSSRGLIDDALVPTRLFQPEQAQLEAIARWDRFWEGRKDKLLTNLELLGRKYKFKGDAFAAFEQWLDKSFSPVVPTELKGMNDLFFDNYVIRTDTLAAIINILKIDQAAIEAGTVYEILEQEPGTWVIDKRVITSEFIGILKDNFDKLVMISLSLVFLILLIAYGRIELTLITMIPIFISWVWVVGIMAMLGISFNIFNIIILTFIFGLGIDYSIFVMRGLLQQSKYGHKDISSYRVSIIISGITTLLGIGVLIFARHPALQSIATMSIIGIFSVILLTLTLLPPVFRWMVHYKKGPRNRPVTLLDLIFSLASLFVFVGGALLMSLFSLVLRIIPLKTKRKKYIFHVVFSKMTWFLIYMNFLSPKRIINTTDEDYSRPAIIIANHQSHIDLMLMMLLNPRVLVLTNRRNYTHPFYGIALQYADFLPSDMGYEEIAEDLQSLIKDGYSFMIFPEGHRNDDGKIRRFHKGAFYLADKLKIDILPIIIHGQNQLLKKSEFFLKRGSITTKFLPRIDLQKKEYGDNVREQTKGINRYFRKAYAEARKEWETPDYWSDYIVKNFTFKGPVLEWYTRIKLKLEENYKFFNELIPRQAVITDLGCGYGYLAFMLILVSDKRTIRAIDYDADKIAIASHCAITHEQLRFETGDITEIVLGNSDVFVLNDVLHYLPAEWQVRVVERCIARLNQGGKIIIRDADAGLRKRHAGTRITEFFSTNFGFNKKKYALDFVSRSVIEDTAKRNQMHMEIIDKTTLTSNLVYILTKKAGSS
jgi:uncharacterized protein